MTSSFNPWSANPTKYNCRRTVWEVKALRVNVGISQGSIFGPTYFPLNINDLPDDIMLMTLPYIVNVIALLIYKNSDSWLLNLNLTCEALDQCKKWLVNFNVRKLNLFYLIVRVTLMLLMWKSMELFFKKNHVLRYWDCLSVLNFFWTRKFSLSLPESCSLDSM